MESHQLINQTSGETDIHTPTDILGLMYEVFGGPPDLDPASSAAANKRVKAKTFYTEPGFDVLNYTYEDGLPLRRYLGWGGLGHRWKGKTWLNSPFGTPDYGCSSGCTKKRCQKRGWHTVNDLPGMSHWVNYLIKEYLEGDVTEALCITFAATSEGWFQPLLQYPQCFPKRRTNYLLPDGTPYKGVTKGSCLTYLGSNVDRFAEVFSALGVIKVPYRRS